MNTKPSMDSETDEDARLTIPGDHDNETSEALSARNLTDMEASDLPVNMTASMTTVKRGYSDVVDPEVTDAGIDSNENRYGGRLDQGGFLGRPNGFAR